MRDCDTGPRRLLRLDVMLVAFAAAGGLATLLLPEPAPAARGRQVYTLAIATGDDLRLARSSAVGESDFTARRALACRRILSMGPVDVGTSCRPASNRARRPGPGAERLSSAD